MLICNLNTLMAERNLKITKIAKDTGISRTTLTSLANNYSQGIQFDTLNKLCMYLNINPCDFFTYINFNIEVSEEIEFDYLNSSYANINLRILDIYNDDTVKLFFNLKFIKTTCSIKLKLSKLETDIDFFEIFNSLDIKLLKTVEGEISSNLLNLIIDEFNEFYLKKHNYNINFIFDWKL